MVPRLRIRSEDLTLRTKPTRIIQTTGQNSNNVRRLINSFRAGDSRTAIGAKTAFMFSAGEGQTRSEMMTQFAARQPKRLCRHDNRGRKSTARNVLTIPAVTLEHHDRFRVAFVANRAACASAGKRNLHPRYCHQSGISASTSLASRMSDSCQPR
jgi:hypothetical protein